MVTYTSSPPGGLRYLVLDGDISGEHTMEYVNKMRATKFS